MISLDRFKEIISNESRTEKTSSPKGQKRSSRYGASGIRRLAPKTAVAKAHFVQRLLDESGFGSEGDLSWTLDAIFSTDDPALTVTRASEGEFRQFLPEEAPVRKTRAHHTIALDLKGTGRELLKLRLFQRVRNEKRLEDALVRISQAALRGYERTSSNDPTKGARQDQTLCVVAIRDDRKTDKSDAPYLVCFATRWRDGHTGETSLVHFFLKQTCVDWEPQLRDAYLTQIYDRYFCKLAGDHWQRAFITGEEWQAAKEVLASFGQEKSEQQVRAGVQELLEKIAQNFELSTGSGGSRLEFTRSKEHAIGLNPDEKLNSQKAEFEATVVRDLEEHLLGYIIYCVDSTDEADTLRASLSQNCFENVLVLAPDEDDDSLNFEVWQANKGLKDKLIQAGAQESLAARLISTLARFFVVGQSDVVDANGIATQLAARAKHLRQSVQLGLHREAGDGPLTELYKSYKINLVHSLSEKDFADAYAQTVTYALLAARWLSRHSDRRFRLAEAEEYLPTTSPFLSSLATKLLNMERSPRIRWLLQDITSLLERIDVEAVFESERNNNLINSDPVIHFYEPFLDKYDPKIKQERGVYYTPDEVVSAMVHMSDDLVRERFGLPMGLASDKKWGDYADGTGVDVPEGVHREDFVVQILDPAAGTGTFLKQVIELIRKRMLDKWEEEGLDEAAQLREWQRYVPNKLLPRLYGFEIMMAPYVICHLRLELLLEETGFEFGAKDRMHVLLTDTLAQQIPGQQDLVLGEALAKEAEEADRIKNKTPITVILGNPPYDREEVQDDGSHYGGWIRDGWSGWKEGHAPLEDFARPTREAGKGGHLKNIYNLYVYFWRWAMWKALDQQASAPSVVTFITPSSFLGGKGFLGMRERIREQLDLLYVLDLEGDQRGARKSDNVFNILTPVTVAAGYAGPECNKNCPTRSFYKRVKNSRSEKLDFAAGVQRLQEVDWRESSDKWHDSFYGASSSSYQNWNRITDLFPWQHSGSQMKRTWPVGEVPSVLKRRWRLLLRCNNEAQQKEFFKETRDRKITKSCRHPIEKKRLPPIKSLKDDALHEPIVRYGFRSFDRQWVFFDCRLGDFMRTSLWATYSDEQFYLTGLLTKVLGNGAALTVSAHVPDLHYFCGRGGKDAIPVWRDPASRTPNITKGLLEVLEEAYGEALSPVDLFAYVYAVLGHPHYTKQFREELSEPGPRVPITKDEQLFKQGAAIGRKLIALHTYGERLNDEKVELKGRARIKNPIPQSPENYPESFSYDASSEVLRIGSGEIGGVTREVYEFSVSGLQVVKSWLDYRMKSRAGKKSSPLDDIRPKCWTPDMTRELLELLWVLEKTLEMYPELEKFFKAVLKSDLFTADELPEPTEREQKAPRIKRIAPGDQAQTRLGLTEA